MAHSIESAGSGSASGSAPQHVPAIHAPIREAVKLSLAERVKLAEGKLIDGVTMLESIKTLADCFREISDDLEVQSLAEAVKACAEKAGVALEEAESALCGVAGKLPAAGGAR